MKFGLKINSLYQNTEGTNYDTFVLSQIFDKKKYIMQFLVREDLLRNIPGEFGYNINWSNEDY